MKNAHVRRENKNSSSPAMTTKKRTEKEERNTKKNAGVSCIT